MEYRQVQKIAKDTIAYARQIVRPGMDLRSLRRLCEEKMRELGADSFWYWDVGAFVFAGDETAVSVSGRQYAKQPDPCAGRHHHHRLKPPVRGHLGRLRADDHPAGRRCGGA